MTGRPTALIDLSALRANWRALARPDAETGAVVKADAYGHGTAPVGRALHSEGCRSFFVAHVEEGESLRAAIGPEADIYVLNGPEPDNAAAMRTDRLIPIANSPGQLDLCLSAGFSHYAVKFDTGMNRLGLPLQSLAEMGDRMRARPPALILSHLACADEPGHALNPLQLQRFQQVMTAFPGIRGSLCNSAGLFLGPDYVSDLSRPGIALYGGGGHGLAPVMTLSAQVIDVFDGVAGSTVGYGATARLDRPHRLATLAIGYGDGFLRTLSGRGRAFIDGRACRIMGRVSMDLTTIDVTGLDVAPGDRAELFGPNLDLEAQAARGGSVGYELVTGLTPRVLRRYIGA